MFKQRTIREKVNLRGVGLHSGQHIRMEILPAPEDNGITFVRADLPAHPELKASVENLVATTLATTLGVSTRNGMVAVATVEHLLAAFLGLGVDNARILLDGPEVPVLDGSAGPFVDALLGAGFEEQRRSRRLLVIKKEVRIRDGEKMARIVPGAALRVKCSLAFDNPLILPATFHFRSDTHNFQREIARARTFGFLHEVAYLRSRGLALGGSLDNAIVIDNYRVLNPEGLRFPDEFARHKVLDALGDLSLFGMPVVGHVTLHCSGHTLNTRLVQAVLADARAYGVVESADAETPAVAGDSVSPLAVFETAEGIA